MYQFALHWVYYRYHFILNYIFLIAGSVIPELWKFYMQKYIIVPPLSPLEFFYFKHRESWLCFITACIIFEYCNDCVAGSPSSCSWYLAFIEILSMELTFLKPGSLLHYLYGLSITHTFGPMRCLGFAFIVCFNQFLSA